VGSIAGETGESDSDCMFKVSGFACVVGSLVKLMLVLLALHLFLVTNIYAILNSLLNYFK
jgi:hypothetical protein